MGHSCVWCTRSSTGLLRKRTDEELEVSKNAPLNCFFSFPFFFFFFLETGSPVAQTGFQLDGDDLELLRLLPPPPEGRATRRGRALCLCLPDKHCASRATSPAPSRRPGALAGTSLSERLVPALRTYRRRPGLAGSSRPSQAPPRQRKSGRLRRAAQRGEACGSRGISLAGL